METRINKNDQYAKNDGLFTTTITIGEIKDGKVRYSVSISSDGTLYSYDVHTDYVTVVEELIKDMKKL